MRRVGTSVSHRSASTRMQVPRSSTPQSSHAAKYTAVPMPRRRGLDDTKKQDPTAPPRHESVDTRHESVDTTAPSTIRVHNRPLPSSALATRPMPQPLDTDITAPIHSDPYTSSARTAVPTAAAATSRLAEQFKELEAQVSSVIDTI